jgi:hypothetical protein
MNRSKTKAQVNRPWLWSYARRLLHAFAEAGQPLSAGPQLFLGPNGGLMWTDVAQIDRSEPYGDGVFSIPEKSSLPVGAESPVIVNPQQAAASTGYRPLEAPVPN